MSGPPKFTSLLQETSETGFTKDEQIISNLLVDVRNAFVKLEVQHPSDRSEFDQAIHVLQGILAIRILRRDYPKGWATIS